MIGLVQSFTYYILLKNNDLLFNPSVWSAIVIIASFTAGSAIIMWLGEQITDKGIGNGISILLFVGIVARFPQIGMTIFSYFAQGGWYILLMAAVIVLFACHDRIYRCCDQRGAPYPGAVRKAHGWT